jgi:L-fuculose-phosphate aldolase
MLAAADGNISFRLSDNRILFTPSGMNKIFLKPSDLAIVDIKNNIIKGHPSSERLMHLEIYRSCPLAKCIVHAHPPNAVAWSIAKPSLKKLPADAVPEIILAAGEIPIIPYARPSTEDMGRNLRRFLPDHRVMILARHGAVTWGETMTEAYNGMERVEHAAEILRLAATLGPLTSLPKKELAALKKMRAQKGNKTL